MREAESPVLGDQPLWSAPVLAEFYWSRDYRLAWTRPETLKALRSAMERAREDGLDPADFYDKSVATFGEPGVLDRLGRAERLAADIRLSDALLRYVYILRFGRLDPVEVDRSWNHRGAASATSLISDMSAALEADDPVAQLAEIAPKPFFYARLKKALAEYQGDRRLRDLPQIPAGKRLTPGMRDPRVPLIRERLSMLGDYRDGVPSDPEVFDSALRTALTAFQSRNGLTADGVAGPGTVVALNRPYDPSSVDKIRINLERMRWLYDRLPDDYVLVDVAGFMAHVVRGGKVEWSTRVVVGTPDKQTPSFRDEMEHVVFNPTWTVPPSIQKTMRGAGKFKMVDRRTGRAVSGGNANDWRRYSLVQPPGPKNALGRVKFIFPNNQSVYLHDTPSKSLFSLPVRAYSHGCVRVQNPVKLAEVILNKPAWGESEISRVIATERTRYVFLQERLPVLLYYLTAVADENGRVSFRRDIYGRDAAVREAFAKGPSEPRVTFGKPEPVVVPDPEAASTAVAVRPSDLPGAVQRLPKQPEVSADTQVEEGGRSVLSDSAEAGAQSQGRAPSATGRERPILAPEGGQKSIESNPSRSHALPPHPVANPLPRVEAGTVPSPVARALGAG